MLLRDLVARHGLGLRLLHGDDAALDRPLRWVYTTDLIDPGRYLSGGELVVSGLVWRREPSDSDRFVAALAHSGAAALAAGATVFHGVPDDVVEACRRHDVPLVEVPEDVSFATITELVITELTAARGARLAHTVGRQRRLLSAVADGLGLDELARQVSQATGTVCRVISTTGREIVPGPQPLTTDVVDRLVSTFLTADQLPATLRRDRCTVFPVGPAAERLSSWLVVVEGDPAGWDADTTDVVNELAAIAALDRARRGEGVRVARAIADEAVTMIAAGAANVLETSARLRHAGLDPAEPLVVAVAGFVGQPERAELACAVLVDAATHLGPPMVGVHAGTAVALLPDGDRAGSVLRRALERLVPGLAGERLAVGVSRSSRPETLTGALHEARHAHDVAALRAGVLQIVTDAETASHVALLAAVPDDVRRAFAVRVLGPVLDHDARTGAGLRVTLEAFLDCSGSWIRTAERLHLHVNTVRYRIGRVEELTGRDLGALPDRVDVFLALRSL
jgi:Purine catabolism regulatory protein-like family/PucR C-terminal helix-turn-helix domain/GGDEF-like domain